jgi:ABC-type glycerol-3-phosphate transport system permease component
VLHENICLILEVKNLGPWAKGLLKGTPAAAAGPAAMAPSAKYPLVLAEDRTRRPDVLRHLRVYEGGWNVTNKHYWASVSFTGVSGFLLAALWFIFSGMAAVGRCYFGSRMAKRKVSRADIVQPVLLVVFALTLIAGCIVLLYGQSKFHEEATRTVDFVVNQSDFTIQSLRNVTEYLSFAQTITVAALYLPSDIQGQIDNLKGDLNKAADTISQKTAENYKRIRKVLHIMSVVLICIAALLPVLAFLGYVLELYGPRYTVYIFVTLCCKMVAALFILLGIFLILNSAAKDTCEAMDQWAQHPQAETALSNILPCVDESTTNRTLYQSKEVVVMLVRIVNRAISALSNRRPHHKHPGQLMPYLCSPYDSNFNDRPCKSREVTFENATTAWQNYTCLTQDTDLCSGNKTLTPEIYGQLVLAANVSYALYYYAPVLLSFQDCKFVRATFSAIALQYCPPVERDLGLVSAGLALIASGLILYLVWMLFADRPQREEVSDLASVSRITPVDSSPLP